MANLRQAADGVWFGSTARGSNRLGERDETTRPLHGDGHKCIFLRIPHEMNAEKEI